MRGGGQAPVGFIPGTRGADLGNRRDAGPQTGSGGAPAPPSARCAARTLGGKPRAPQPRSGRGGQGRNIPGTPGGGRSIPGSPAQRVSRWRSRSRRRECGSTRASHRSPQLRPRRVRPPQPRPPGPPLRPGAAGGGGPAHLRLDPARYKTPAPSFLPVLLLRLPRAPNNLVPPLTLSGTCPERRR